MGYPKKIQGLLTLKDIYKYYNEKYEKSKFELEYKIFREICETFNKYVMTEIIEEGYFFKLPYRIGIIRIKKREVNLDSLKKDYGTYNSSDQTLKIGHLNEHTNNQYVKYYWSKFYTDNMVKNKTWYAFIPTRTNTRRLASLLKTNGSSQINKYFN